MKQENIEKEEKFQSVKEYINARASVLVSVADTGKYLYTAVKRGAVKRGSATLGYYDTENVKFDVSGYNLVFVGDEGAIMHVKIIPGQIASLSKANQLHEREELENELEKAGFVIDDSEQFRSVIAKCLEKK